MDMEAHYHSILLVANYKRPVVRKVQSLGLHQHFGEVASQSIRRIRRRRTRGMHQARHPLHVIAARRKATKLSIVAILRYVHSSGRRAILRFLFRRSNPHATSPIYFRGRSQEDFLDTKQTHRNMERRRMSTNPCNSKKNPNTAS
jgi:hypothetical protein